MKRNWKRFLSAVLALCLCASLAPAAFAAGTNELGLPIETITLTTAAQEQSNGSYSVSYTATLSQGVGDTYAKIVALNKDDTESLESLRFTCTLSDSLIAQIPDSKELTSGDFTFDGGSVFTFISAGESSSGITILYKLNESAVSGWGSMTTEAVHDAVMKSLTMTATRTVTAAQMSAALSGSNKITSTAKVELSAVDANDDAADIPYFGGDQTAVTAEGTATMTIRYYSSGSSSSSSKPTYPVETSDADNGTVSTSVSKAAKDQKVTIEVTPDAGYVVNRVIVTDEDGNQIEIRATGDNNTYTLEAPGTAVNVEATFIREPVSPAVTGVDQMLNTDPSLAYLQGMADNNFYPDDPITRGQVATIFYRLLVNTDVDVTKTFRDVPEDLWCADAINTLAALGIVKGITNEEYAPNRPITRAQLVAICARFAQTSTAGERFLDVPESYWAYDYITTASGYGWINGIGNDLFAPDQPITRAETATVVNRMLARIADRAAIDDEEQQYDDVYRTYWAWYDISEASTGVLPR